MWLRTPAGMAVPDVHQVFRAQEVLSFPEFPLSPTGAEGVLTSCSVLMAFFCAVSRRSLSETAGS